MIKLCTDGPAEQQQVKHENTIQVDNMDKTYRSTANVISSSRKNFSHKKNNKRSKPQDWLAWVKIKIEFDHIMNTDKKYIKIKIKEHTHEG